MKKSVLLFSLVFIFLTAGSFKEYDTKNPTIEGTWELQSFYNYDGENVIDTIKKSDGYRQVKMYSKKRLCGHDMYRMNPMVGLGTVLTG